MRTSLNETKEIDDHVFHKLATGDALLFEARLQLDQRLSENLIFQQQAYNLIQQYSRKKMKVEIALVHQKLSESNEHRGFIQKIKTLFLNK